MTCLEMIKICLKLQFEYLKNKIKKILWWSHENDFFSKVNTI